jgi:hypothetical protein
LRRKSRGKDDEDRQERQPGRGKRLKKGSAEHDGQGERADEETARKATVSTEFPDQTKINFCRLGRLKARPEQSPPH